MQTKIEIHLIGYPIAWCIADQENTDVVLLLFKSIKERSPSTKVTVLMSDDGKLNTLQLEQSITLS